jgi:hypothetical protein
MGSGFSYVIILLVRSALHIIIGKDFTLGARKPKRVAIVGLKKESKRVKELLLQTGVSTNLIGFITPKRKIKSDRYMGSIYQIDEIVRINSIEELIFCSADVRSQMVIKTMLNLSDFNINYKIAPPESISIIGSNSIDTAGDLYVVNVNAITKEKNRRNKRLFDILVSLVFLLSFPFTVWFINLKRGFFVNIFNVLFHKKSWVGYHQINTEMYMSLPAISQGILKTTELQDHPENNPEIIDRINMLYARDYSLGKDFEIVMKAFKKLGQK